MTREETIRQIENLIQELRSENELTYINISEKVSISLSPHNEGEHIVINHVEGGQTSVHYNDDGVKIYIYDNDCDCLEPVHAVKFDRKNPESEYLIFLN